MAQEMRGSVHALIFAGAELGEHAGYVPSRYTVAGKSEEEEDDEDVVMPLELGLVADLSGGDPAFAPLPRHALGSPSKDASPPHSHMGLEQAFLKEFEEVQSKLDHLTV